MHSKSEAADSLAELHEPEHEVRERQTVSSIWSTLVPKSILVVDDAAFVRRLLRDVLVDAGYNVHEAVSGEDAIEKYIEVRPDLVTMDLGMPGMGGFDTIRRILARDEQARIVVVSAACSEEIIAGAQSLGVRAYVRKPFQPATVLDVVRKALLVPPGPRC